MCTISKVLNIHYSPFSLIYIYIYVPIGPTIGYCRTIGTPVWLEGSEKIRVQVRGLSLPPILCYDLGRGGRWWVIGSGSELGALVVHVKATGRVDSRMSLRVGVCLQIFSTRCTHFSKPPVCFVFPVGKNSGLPANGVWSQLQTCISPRQTKQSFWSSCKLSCIS